MSRIGKSIEPESRVVVARGSGLTANALRDFFDYYLVVKSCLTLFDPMDHSPPGFSVHGVSQARILEWVTISFSRGSS